jgi:hypothetical protein
LGGFGRPFCLGARLLFACALAQNATIIRAVRPAAKIATWLIAAPFMALTLGTIAADGMAIPNDEILTGALCIAGFIFAAVGCVSLLTWKK